MSFGDLVRETLLSLTGNKVRSLLTILGIVVGIASVIALIAVGEGSQAAVTQRFQSVGANQLTIRPSSPNSGGGFVRRAATDVQSLTRADAEAVAGVPGVSAVAPQSSSFAQVVAGSSNTNAQLTGVTPDYAAINGLSTSSGSFITAHDDEASSKVAVLGYQAAIDLFGEGTDPVGRRIRAGSMQLTVEGVLNQKQGSGFGQTDSAIFMPLSTQQRFVSGNEYLSSITFTVADQSQINSVQSAVTDLLLTRHKITDSTQADFQIQNIADLLSAVTQTTGTFTTLLASIASISLLVGGIGIMNMMLTTVTERTREIGLRKAIGANEGAITAQFLAESVTLTLVGGVVGIAIGWAVAVFLAPSLLGTQAVVSWRAVALAAGVSALIGVVFGFYPAQRAARMNPIEALRYQ